MTGHELVGRIRCTDRFYYKVSDGVCQGCKKKLRVIEVDESMSPQMEETARENAQSNRVR